MINDKYNLDSKENLGHGIKGDISKTANDLRNDKNNMKNKITNDKINKD